MSTLSKYYTTLGLAPGASKEQVRKAYRRLAIQYHPDKNKSPNAKNKFIEITYAYDVLTGQRKAPVPKVRVKTPEEKWSHVQQPPQNKSDFEEWYKVKKEQSRGRFEREYQRFKDERVAYEKSLLYYFALVLRTIFAALFIAVILVVLAGVFFSLIDGMYILTLFSLGLAVFLSAKFYNHFFVRDYSKYEERYHREKKEARKRRKNK